MVGKERPTHVYIGRLSCGCAMALASDYGDKHTAGAVADFISGGMTIERVEWQKYADEICHEETFMNCPHEEQNEQPLLFSMED